MHVQSLGAFRDLGAVHNQRVDDPVSPLAAAHGLHAAVVVAQCEVRFRAVLHKLPLQVQSSSGESDTGCPLQASAYVVCLLEL